MCRWEESHVYVVELMFQANKDFAGSQPAMHHNNLHAGTASAMHSEYDEVFISSAGENQPLPSGASSLQLPEMPNAPLARFDSAMDDDPQLLLSRSSIMGRVNNFKQMGITKAL